jgi:iron complex outermembrane receptor protein
VLIDGRSVYAPSSFGGVDWSGLALTVDEIERIEVVRGTNSNAFGANAFLGVINIITRHSQQDRGSRGQVNLGNHGIADVQAVWSGGSDDLGVRISAVQTRDNGFSGVNDSRHSQVLSLRSDYRLDARNELTLRAGYNKGERGQGYPDSIFDNNAVRTMGSADYSLHLTWRHTAGEDEEWLASLYHNRESGTDNWLANGAANGRQFLNVPLSRSGTSTRSNAELQHRFALNPQARLVWGLEARQDESDALPLFAGNPPPHELYRAFSNLDWRLTPAWQLNLGALVEKTAPPPPSSFRGPSSTGRPAPPTPSGRVIRGPGSSATCSKCMATCAPTTRRARRGRCPSPGPTRPTPTCASPRGYHRAGLPGPLPVHRRDPRRAGVQRADQRLRDPPALPISPLGQLALPLPTSQFTNLNSAVELRGVEYQLRTRPWRGGELLLSHTVIDRRMKDEEIRERTSPYSASLTWLQSYPAGWTSTASLLRMGPLAGGYGYVPGCDHLEALHHPRPAHRPGLPVRGPQGRGGA